MRRTGINYPAIGFGIFIFALLAITADHWSEVAQLFTMVKDVLLAELGPAALIVAGIAWAISAVL